MQDRFGKVKGLLQLRRRSVQRAPANQQRSADPEIEQLSGFSQHAEVGAKQYERKRQKSQNTAYYDGGASDCEMDGACSPVCPSVRSLFGKPNAGRSEDDKWSAAHDRIVEAHYCSIEVQDREALIGPIARVRSWLSSREAVSDNNVDLSTVCPTCTQFEQTVRVIFLEAVVNVHFKCVSCNTCVLSTCSAAMSSVLCTYHL